MRPYRDSGGMPALQRTSLYFLYSVVQISPQLDVGGTVKEPGWGTGFLIAGESSGAEAYVVTAAHVVDPARRKAAYVGSQLVGLRVRHWFRPVTDLDSPPSFQEYVLTSPKVTYADEHDIALVLRDPDHSQLVTGDGQSNWMPDSMLTKASEFECGRIWPGQDVLVPGFPGARSGEPPTRPFLFAGTVATDPAHPAQFDGSDHPGVFICQGFSWGGTSGAPVLGLSSTEPRLIGVNTGHIDLVGETAGVLATVVRSDVVLGLLAKARCDAT